MKSFEIEIDTSLLDIELQKVEIIPEKTNAEKIKELLDKCNQVLEKVDSRRKKQKSQTTRK